VWTFLLSQLKIWTGNGSRIRGRRKNKKICKLPIEGMTHTICELPHNNDSGIRGGSFVFREEMEIVADPYNELPLRNDKYAKLCNELHLGSRNITLLNGDFLKFPNLAVLWLNNNRLSNIEHLYGNVRLKYLYLHYNRLQILPDLFHNFPFLEYLTLNNNLLNSLSNVLEELRVLKHLKYLDLFNNPISQEDNYRLLVLAELPWLESLDRIPVTQKEITSAKKLKIKLKKLNNLQLASTSSPTVTFTEESFDGTDGSNFSPRTRSLNLLIPRIRQLFAQKRVYFKDICLQYDRRRLGLMTCEDFKTCLIQFNIFSQLTEEEYQHILQKYTIPTPIPAITLTDLIVTPTTQQKQQGSRTKREVMKNMRMADDMVNYDLFCQDTLPQPLQHTKKPLSSTSSSTSSHTYTATSTSEKVPEISRTVRDLILSVKKYETEMKQNEEKKKRETILNASYATEGSGSFTFYKTATNSLTGATSTSTSTRITTIGGGPGEGLDPWLIGQLRTILTEISHRILLTSGPSSGVSSKKLSLTALCNHTSPEIQFTSSDLQEVFSRMESLGKTIKGYSSQEFISRLLLLKNKNKTPVSAASAGIPLREFCQVLQLDSSLPTLPASSSAAGGLGVGGIRIEWRDLTEKERREIEKREFTEAQECLQQILRPPAPASTSAASAASSASVGKGGGGEAAGELWGKTFQKSITGTRMTASAWGTGRGPEAESEEREREEEREGDPHRVIRSAPNRSDVIVIPALRSAAQRQRQLDELQKENDWTEHFQRFGLRSEGLELALKRKQRSLLGQNDSTLLPPSQHQSQSQSLSLSSSLGASSRTGTGKVTLSGKAGGGEGKGKGRTGGWSSTTGTIVFK
jgi:hypothetical protein